MGAQDATADSGLELSYSDQADRSSASALDGATVSGPIYPFVTPLFPEPGFVMMAFELDGAAFHTEMLPPYDMVSGDTDRATLAWDTTSVADGTHTVTATGQSSDGTTASVTATFDVDNSTDPGPGDHMDAMDDPDDMDDMDDDDDMDDPDDTDDDDDDMDDTGDFTVGYSTMADRSGAEALDGAVVVGDVYAFVDPLFPPGYEDITVGELHSRRNAGAHRVRRPLRLCRRRYRRRHVRTRHDDTRRRRAHHRRHCHQTRWLHDGGERHVHGGQRRAASSTTR